MDGFATPPEIQAQYHRDALTGRLLAALTTAGLDVSRLGAADLAPLDQFHTGGRPATLALMRTAGLAAGTRILDAGGGLGGAARTLAVEAGCRVTVLDLASSYCEAGAELTTRCGLGELVTFVCGSALSSPFAGAAFDVVWTQHSTMNVAEKPALLREMWRVLRPGGRLVMHEVMAGPEPGPLAYPVPWASNPAMSALVPPERWRDLGQSLGFRERSWEDHTAPSRAAVGALAARLTGSLPALGLHLLLEDFPLRTANYLRALETGRVSVIQAVWERPAE